MIFCEPSLYVVHIVIFISLFAIFPVPVSMVDIKTGMVPRVAFVTVFPLFLAPKTLLAVNISLLVGMLDDQPGVLARTVPQNCLYGSFPQYS